MKYDVLFFNNSTKKDYLFQEQVDTSSTPIYHTFNHVDLSGLPSGEYTVYTVRNVYGKAVTWTIQDVPLNSTLTYNGNDYILRDLKPEITLIKIGMEDTLDNSEYRAKNEEYTYRKRK